MSTRLIQWIKQSKSKPTSQQAIQQGALTLPGVLGDAKVVGSIAKGHLEILHDGQRIACGRQQEAPLGRMAAVMSQGGRDPPPHSRAHGLGCSGVAGRWGQPELAEHHRHQLPPRPQELPSQEPPALAS